MAIIFISHFIEDVLEICERVTILRSGQVIDTRNARELDKHAVIHAMLGHRLNAPEVGYESGVSLPSRTRTPPVLVAEGLALPGAFGPLDLAVSPGECLGLYGFVGSGIQELVYCLAGGAPPHGGTRSGRRPAPCTRKHAHGRRARRGAGRFGPRSDVGARCRDL